MLTANGNETTWNRTEFGVYGRVTNKWKTNYMGGIDVVKLIVTGDGGRETNNTQNGPCNLHQAYPSRVLIPTTRYYMWVRPVAVRRCFIHSNLKGSPETTKDGDSDGR
jgi:hypothetical protein